MVVSVRDFYHDAIGRVRGIRPNMPVMMHDSFRPYRWGTMLKNWPYENVYMDNHAYHGFNIADIASDNPKADRQKQYTHEKIGCSYKSQLHFQTCNAVPVMVGEFSLAIDNCMPFLDARYVDFGQCRDIASRLQSPWWDRHIKSFAMRQISTYERELGWAFWTYKVEADLEATQPSAYFWSFHLAMKKGYVDKSFFGNRDACLYAPLEDYAEGDGTDDNTAIDRKEREQQISTFDNVQPANSSSSASSVHSKSLQSTETLLASAAVDSTMTATDTSGRMSAVMSIVFFGVVGVFFIVTRSRRAVAAVDALWYRGQTPEQYQTVGDIELP